jgi:phosphorylase/glycogen(starch) synthase
MWQGVWKGLHHSDIPIRYVTNGIHVPSVVHPRMHDLLDTYLGLDWPRNITDAKLWKRVNDIPNSALWRVKCGLKQDLIGTIRENVSRHWLKYGDARTWREEVLARLNPAALIIGFARRFAPYKRADLILHDLDRLDRIVNHEKRPVHVVFAGKAHPNDGDGIELLRKVIQLGNDPRFRGKVFYLEGYDLGIARGLLHGVDVWLNTPTRPFEACGTSGQKAVVNGTLNLSICDGWWCEGYDGTNGWTIGPVVTELDPTAQSSSEADSKALYALIEEQVVPLFYERDESGVPQKWVTMVKRAMETLVPRFNSKRMVLEYHDTMYVPAAERGLAVARDRCALAREIADWKRKIPMRFSSVRLLDVSLGGIQGDSIEVGKPFSVSLRLDPGKLDPSEILVELLVGRKDGADFLRPPDCIRLKQVESKGGVLTFGAEYAAPENGRYHYGIRAMPFHPHLAFKHESELVLWA